MKRASVFGALSADSMFPIVLWEEEVEIYGWVRTIRESKNVTFIVLYDGSTFDSLQVVVDASLGIDLTLVSSGAAIKVVGMPVESKGSGQAVDFQTSAVEIIGEAGPEYPIQPKKHTMEFFREHGHLRMRTQLFQAIFRIRHAVAISTHEFFDKGKFIYVNTPIISGSDCEGAGEMFRVTTLDGIDVSAKRVSEDGVTTTEYERHYDNDFFGQEAGLTVSGQLEAETAAMGLGRVYTFGPTFRAENSQTSRHLSEFWMVEPEMAFTDLEFNMVIAEGYLRSVIKDVLNKCDKELKYLQKYIQDEEKGMKESDKSAPLIEKLVAVYSEEFERVTYTEAFDILRSSKPNKKGKFEFPVET